MIKFRIFFSFLTFAYITSPKANDPKDLDLLGIKINYGNGSWVNPNEKIFKIKDPSTWFTRSYIRHYIQGSNELRNSVIDLNWKGLYEASKGSKKIPMNEFIAILDYKRAYKCIKRHPEGIIGTTTLALNTASNSVKNIFMIMKTTFKSVKLVSIGLKKIRR
ncbi:MAG: hypothetical protein HOB58_06640 [Nitrospina sp.]|jgi:hypothetical protein|nr:hypothetical protein [Nitrospina sp.]